MSKSSILILGYGKVSLLLNKKRWYLVKLPYQKMVLSRSKRALVIGCRLLLFSRKFWPFAKYLNLNGRENSLEYGCPRSTAFLGRAGKG